MDITVPKVCSGASPKMPQSKESAVINSAASGAVMLVTPDSTSVKPQSDPQPLQASSDSQPSQQGISERQAKATPSLTSIFSETEATTTSADKIESVHTLPSPDTIGVMSQLSMNHLIACVLDLFSQFERCQSEKMPQLICEINQYLHPDANITEDGNMAITHWLIRQTLCKRALQFYKNLQSIDTNCSEALKLAYTSQFVAMQAEHESPELACQYAIKSLIHAAGYIMLPTSTGISKGWSIESLKFVQRNLKRMKQCSQEETIQQIRRAVQAYINITGNRDGLSWEVLNAIHSDALKIPPADDRLGLYWSLYQSFCSAFKNKQVAEGNTSQAAFYNSLGLQALHGGIQHGMPSAYWDAGMLKLGLLTDLVDSRMKTKEGIELFDCKQSENHFQLCDKLNKLPHYSCSDAEKQDYLKSETSILSGEHHCTDNIILGQCGIERLFGSYRVDQDISKAEALFELVPGYLDCYRTGLRFKKKRCISVRLLTNHQGSHHSDSAASKQLLLNGKLLFLRGLKAEQDENEDVAKTCFLASALTGFAGGYTKFAQHIDMAKEAKEWVGEASDRGDISAWHLMGDIQLGKERASTAKEYYIQAMQTYQQHGFCEEAGEIQELLDQLESNKSITREAISYEAISHEATSYEAISSKKNKKKKKGGAAKSSSPRKPKAQITTKGEIKYSGKKAATSMPSVDLQSEQIRQLTETTRLSVKDETHEPLTTTEASIVASSIVAPGIVAPSPAAVTPSDSFPQLPEITIKPLITGRFGLWAEQMMVMRNDMSLIVRHEKSIKDSKCDPHKMIEDASINNLSKLLKQNSLKRFPEDHFRHSTWLALRLNMNDENSALFCDTVSIKRHHAEVNMQKHLLRQLQKGGVQTVEILITRNPCDDDRSSAGTGGCWKILWSIITGYPEIRWHIRFIHLNCRHRYPKDATRGLTIYAFEKSLDKPEVWDNKIQYPTVAQEQVQKSLEQPNLSYSAVPTRNPKKIKNYYNEDNIDKFTPEKFDINPHFPNSRRY